MSDAFEPVRGVKDLEAARLWLRERRIEDVECIVPDQSGVARGKMMPTEKFFSAATMTLPSSIFAQTISGDYPGENDDFQHDPIDGDLYFEPDYSTLAVVPWASDPTAQIIHNACDRDGNSVDIAPRQVLQRVLALYHNKGLAPIVAPELEFYLVKPNADADYPLEPPIGRSGRPETGRQSYSIAAVNEFDDLFDDIYDFCEAQGLEIDTLIHEEGAAQMEINLRHGPPLELADQVFMFKRTIREAALRHKMYATFMAKPMSQEPGSAMHIHQSVLDRTTGENIFSNAAGGETDAFHHFLGGMQIYLPSVLCMMAPYVNSYRRMVRGHTAPTNVEWGYDNRTVGLRIPNSGPNNRRVENRVPSSDANPYLAIAASLACGYLGLEKALRPRPNLPGSARDLPFGLPRGLPEAIDLFGAEADLTDVFGRRFVATYQAIKAAEFETFMSVISAWEREYLLLNV